MLFITWAELFDQDETVRGGVENQHGDTKRKKMRNRNDHSTRVVQESFRL